VRYGLVDAARQLRACQGMAVPGGPLKTHACEFPGSAGRQVARPVKFSQAPEALDRESEKHPRDS
jgi:hypothetical protein